MKQSYPLKFATSMTFRDPELPFHMVFHAAFWRLEAGHYPRHKPAMMIRLVCSRLAVRS